MQVQKPSSQLIKQVIYLALLHKSAGVSLPQLGQTASIAILLENVKMSFRLKVLFMSIDKVRRTRDLLYDLKLFENLLFRLLVLQFDYFDSKHFVRIIFVDSLEN